MGQMVFLARSNMEVFFFLDKGGHYNIHSITFHWLTLLPYSATIYNNSQLQLRDVRITVALLFFRLLGCGTLYSGKSYRRFGSASCLHHRGKVPLSRTTGHHTPAHISIFVHFHKNLQISILKFSALKDVDSCGFWSGRH